MPLFTPGRRWQPPFYPFKREPLGVRVREAIERIVKGPMFGCRMCGNCLLQETAFICPMECPKGVRNGPCGGSTSEHCYVDETRPCLWYKIYDRAFRMGREEKLLEVLPPLDAEPVMQIAARDRTRTGLQGEVLGANALGVRNILCLSGDSIKMSPQPRGRMDVIDLDSIQMLWILRRMRDEGCYLDGRNIKFPPKYFLGAAAAPFASEARFQAIREHKKVNAGAQFFQTNLVFDPDGLDIWLNEIMAVGWEEIVPRIVTEANLLPRQVSAALVPEITHSPQGKGQ